MKRRSRGKAFRVNTKGPRITSVSLGGGGVRLNAGTRGTRVSAKNPLTGKTISTSLSSGRRTRTTSSDRSSLSTNKKGCGFGCLPFVGIVLISVVRRGILTGPIYMTKEFRDKVLKS